MFIRLRKLILMIFVIYGTPSIAIVNGETLKDHSQSLTYKIKLHQEPDIGSPCSATLISDYTFLTAAHCVDYIYLDRDYHLFVNGQEIEVESFFVPLEYYEAEKYYRNSLGNINEVSAHRNLALFDLAIINTKNPMSEKFRKVDLSFEKKPMNSIVTAAGFGYIHFDSSKYLFYGLSEYSYQRESTLEIMNNGALIIKGRDLNDVITAPGDSGGPLLMAGSSTQIGVLRGSSATYTQAASIYTPIYLHQEFIELFSKALDLNFNE